MKPATHWSYAPYRPPFWEVGDVYICRIAPDEDSVHLEWLDPGAPCTLFWRKRGEASFSSSIGVTGTEYTVTGLDPQTDYEFMVACGEKKSRIRLAHTAHAVGTVVNYLHPDDEAYRYSGHCLCSPCLVRHPDGYLLASMDVFKAGSPQNLTMIFRSDDDGATWHYLTDLYPCFWGRMFIKDGEVYMIACSTEYGDLLIGKSIDGGKTFPAPTVLLRGSCKCGVAGVHKNPQPLLAYRGRLYETLEWGSWGEGYHAAMVASAPEGADLLDASVWRFSDPVKYDPTWKGVAEGQSSGNIEGTLAVLPDGNLYNIMRYDMGNCTPNYGRVLAYRVDTEDSEAPLCYDHAIALPGNHSKFMIRQDPETRTYYTIIDRLTDSRFNHARTLVSLMKSADCENWELACDLLDFRKEDPAKVGFQYVDFFIEGQDILWLCRSAMNGAVNFHDANYSTFHRLRDFRKY